MQGVVICDCTKLLASMQQCIESTKEFPHQCTCALAQQWHMLVLGYHSLTATLCSWFKWSYETLACAPTALTGDSQPILFLPEINLDLIQSKMCSSVCMHVIGKPKQHFCLSKQLTEKNAYLCWLAYEWHEQMQMNGVAVLTTPTGKASTAIIQSRRPISFRSCLSCSTLAVPFIKRLERSVRTHTPKNTAWMTWTEGDKECSC